MNALSTFMKKDLGFPVAFFVITASVALLSTLAIPLKVTVDGINYISSAKALFTPQMATHYVWYREPGYPLFLKLIHELNDAAWLFVFFQGICLGFAAGITFYIYRKSSGQVTASLWQVLVAIVLVANPVFLIYAGLILQQGLFALMLALFALILFWSFRPPTYLNSYWIGLFAIVLYLASITTSVGWIYLGLLPTASVFVVLLARRVLRKPSNTSTKLRSFSINAGLIFASISVLCLTYVTGTQSYKIWESYKTTTMPQSYSMPNVIKPLESVPYIPSAVELSSRMLSIMGIGLQEHYTYENKLFLDQQMRRIWPVAEWDTAYVSKPYSDFAQGYIEITNPNFVAHRALSFTSVFAINAYRMIFLLSFIPIIWSLRRRNWVLFTIQLIPVYFIFVYAASNSPIDRYGVPAFPFAAAGVGILVSWISELLLNRRRNQNNPVTESH